MALFGSMAETALSNAPLPCSSISTLSLQWRRQPTGLSLFALPLLRAAALGKYDQIRSISPAKHKAIPSIENGSPAPTHSRIPPDAPAKPEASLAGLIARTTESRVSVTAAMRSGRSAIRYIVNGSYSTRVTVSFSPPSLVMSTLAPTSILAGVVQHIWPSSFMALVKHCFPSTCT